MTYSLGDTIGFAFTDREDQLRFTKNHAKAWEKLPGYDHALQRLMIGEELQYYTYKSKEEGRKREFALHYVSDTCTKVAYTGIKICRYEDSPFGLHRLTFTGAREGSEMKGALFAQIPEAEQYDLKKGWYHMQIAAYCGAMMLAHSMEEFRRMKSPFTTEAVVPLFRCTDADDEDGARRFTGKTLLCGHVEAYEMRTNTEFGLPYHWVRLRCLSQHFDVLLAPDAVQPDEIRPGDVLVAVALTMSARPLQRAENPQEWV